MAEEAGTGKTIVAVHRAPFLAQRQPDARLLLTTFSPPLAHALHAFRAPGITEYLRNAGKLGIAQQMAKRR